MEDEKKIEQPEQEAESSETSRREFVSKLVTAAGAAALAGLLTSAGADEAEADVQAPPQMIKIDKQQEWRMGKFQTLKLNNGFRLSVSGRDLGTALKSAGLLQEGTNLDNATLTIEFTA
jgi:hypothetical protein